MPAVFIELIKQLNSAVFTLIAILFVIFWLLYKAGGIVKSYKDFEGKNEKFDNKIDNIKEGLAAIRATTDLLYQAHLSTVKSHSPVSLTPKGEMVSKAISAETKVAEHWKDIKAKLEEKNPTNPYDIQTVAMDIAMECFEKIFTAEEQNQIKTYAFSIGLNLLEVYPIIGIIIRDRLFKERGINVEEVDKFVPSISK